MSFRIVCVFFETIEIIAELSLSVASDLSKNSLVILGLAYFLNAVIMSITVNASSLERG